MEKNEPKKYFNISKMFELEEENMIWGIVENVLMRNNIGTDTGKMSIRYYDDGNPELEELGESDETVCQLRTNNHRLYIKVLS